MRIQKMQDRGKNRGRLLSLALATLFVAVTPEASATLSIRIFDGVDYATARASIDLNDDGTGMDLYAGDGVLNYSTHTAEWSNNLTGSSFFAGPFGAFDDVTVNARGIATLGNPGLDALDLNSLDVSGGTGDLTVMMTETDLLKSDASWLVNTGGTAGGSVAFKSYVDSSNVAFGLETLVSDLGILSSGAFPASDSGVLSTSGLYSWTTVATIHHEGGRTITSFDYSISIPEPGLLALMGIGLLGVGIFAGGRRCNWQ